MIKTRIFLVSGFHVDVQESVDEVEDLMAHSAPGRIFRLTLGNGEAGYFQRDYIVHFREC